MYFLVRNCVLSILISLSKLKGLSAVQAACKTQRYVTWKNSMKNDLKEVNWGTVDWIAPRSELGNRGLDSAKVLDLGFSKMRRIFE
jgi:hypothetical protein